MILTFAPPFREVAPEQVEVQLSPREQESGLSVAEALERAGIRVGAVNGSEDPELAAFVTVNGRALTPGARFEEIVKDGDAVSFGLMLSGG